MASARDQIIDTTCLLLEQQGFHGTGLNQIVKESGAPKGSLYYYFPDGKDAIAEAAITRTGTVVAEHIRAALAQTDDVAEAIRQFVTTIAQAVERSGFRSGGPLATIAMETATSNERLNRACRSAYGQFQDAFEAKLRAGGYDPAQAQELAAFIIAAIEGGTILCRTSHSSAPLQTVARQLFALLNATAPR